MVKPLQKIFLLCFLCALCAVLFNVTPADCQQIAVKKTNTAKKHPHKPKPVHLVKKVITPVRTLLAVNKPPATFKRSLITNSSSDTVITADGPLSICNGTYVTLTAQNLPHPDTVQWYNSSGAISNETNQYYYASQAGTYYAMSGSFKYKAVTVVVYALPVANFTATDGTNECASVPIIFTNQSTGSNLTYSWDFGDPNSPNNTSTAKNPTHKFIGSPGSSTQSFYVQLTVTNGSGCTSTYGATVTTQQPTDTNLGPSTVSYNGQNYFTYCDDGPGVLTFVNLSTTQSINQSYTIQWGDGTADYTSTTFSVPVNHTYNTGTYSLNYIIHNVNGCIDTAFYKVFVGSNPAVGLNNPGNTAICTNSVLTFPVTGTSKNPPGTTYTVTFNDGSPPVVYNTSPDTLQHEFVLSSCGTYSGNYANAFSATIVASNPCSSSSAVVSPIYVSQKPVAAFVNSTNSTNAVCTGNSVTFDNTSQVNDVSNNGCAQGNVIWSISPSTGWQSNYGAFGSNNGLTNPKYWNGGDQELSIQFTTPGKYTVRIITGSANCGLDTATQVICVSNAPTAAFTTSVASGCGPLTVKTTNKSPVNSCGSNTYQWSVSPSTGFTYAAGTTSSSPNPQFTFTDPGTYAISLIAISPGGDCTSATVTDTVIITTKPNVSIDNLSGVTICQGNTIHPSATVSGGGKISYLWTFKGAAPATSTSLDPGIVTYTKAGNDTATLVVTNGCSVTTATAVVVVDPTPVNKLPPNQTYCAGLQTSALVLGSNVAGTTFNWSNSDSSIGLSNYGNGNIPSFTTTNYTSAPVTATITVTAYNNGCPGVPTSFTITVNPSPAAPAAIPSVVYCRGEIASALTATAIGNDTLNWYNNANLTGRLKAAPVPSTTTSGTISYYVTQTNAYGCESPPTQISVAVNSGITGNTIGSSQTVCYNTSPNTLAGTGTLNGGDGAYGYQWQYLNNGVWTDITGANFATYTPGNLTATTKYQRLVSSGGCTSPSDTVQITVQGVLGNYDIGASQTICTADVPASLTGQVPAGGNGTFTYQWQVSPDSTNWSVIPAATNINYQPGALSSTTYYRRLTTSGTCSGYSSVVTITVIPPPVVNPVNSTVYCDSTTTSSVAFSSPAAGTINFNWTNDNTLTGLAASGTGTIPSFQTVNTSHLPIVSNISVVASVANGAENCPGAATKFSITVLPVVHVQAIQNQTGCSGLAVPVTVPVNDAANFAGAIVSYNWVVSNPGIGLQNGSGSQIPGFTAINNNGTSDAVATVTVTPVYNYGQNSCTGVPINYTITIKAQPTANAGSDAQLCDATSYQLSGNQPGSGFTGTWADTNNGSTLTFSPDAHTYNATVNGLKPGSNYALQWTITNNACGITSDTVNLQNLAPLTNTIIAPNSTLCLGVAATITGAAATGATGQYQYSWESSTDNTTWTAINGETGTDITINLTTTTYIRRLVISGTCSQESNTVLITIKSAIANNVIGDSGSVCTGFSAGALSGTTATGGDGNFVYQWQSSIDSLATWQPIAGANQPGYTTPVLKQTTWYRRIVSSALCSGAQENISDTVQITVNPNSEANFTATTTTGCVPFNLQQVITPVLYPDRNATYTWYANGVSIGTGSSFPNYSITQDGQTVLIKLITTSKFGCDTASKQLNFSTTKTVAASFTKDQVKGCGPLTVNFTNTSQPLSAATYSWTFGDGQTSTLVQPPAITFQANPANRDTTYVITLRAITTCDTNVYKDSVTVRPKPRAIMTPEKTIGCSPFTITVANESRGAPNTYTFNFGDGSAPLVKYDNSPVQYTYTTTKTDTVVLKLTAQNECGIDSTSYHIVIYPNNVQANLVVNGDNQFGCAPVTVKFFNNSVGASNFLYDFGDGNTETTTSAPEEVDHVYTQAGVYLVKLTASNGCSTATTTQTITIYAQPTATFTVGQSQYCVNAPVVFTNTSMQPGYSYLWDFKDGSTSNETNPVHQFAQPGEYLVTLTILHSYANGSACTSSISHNVEIIPAPNPNFTTNAELLNCAPFTLVTNTTPANATGVQWDFGDTTSTDNTGVGYSLTHTYTNPGVYQVRLIAYNENSCSDTSYQVVRVTQKPLAAFTPGDSVLCGGTTTIKFTNSSTYSGSDLVTYKWLVNNVVVSAQTNLTYTFTPPSNAVFPYTYTIELIAISTIGCQDTVTHTIQFNALPKAGFTVQVSASCAPFQVQVANTSVYADQYKWYLNNVLISTDSIPAQILLNQPGNSYVLKLVAGNQFGCKTDSIQKTITTYPKPVALFTLADSSSCNGILNLQIVNKSTGATSYTWDFGDGSAISTAVTPTHIYGVAGVYTITMVASNGYCLDTTTKTITIAAPPKAAFTADNLKGCDILTVTFQNLSVNANSYVWSFGDGTFSTSKNPTHTYTYVHSPYTVSLAAYGDFGCADSTLITNYINVAQPPKANFDILPDSVIKIPEYSFNFNSTSTGDINKYQWSFGDGTTAVTASTAHTYLDTGIYNVTLVVTNTDDCTDTLTRKAQVQGVPGYLYVPNAFEPGSGRTELKTFAVRASGLATYDLRIYNKWGEMIWESTKLVNSVPSEGWDGTMHGRPAPQGVYVWLISATFINGTEWEGMKYTTGSASKTGSLYLIR